MYLINFLVVSCVISCVIAADLEDLTNDGENFDSKKFYNSTTTTKTQNELNTLRPLSCQFVPGTTVGNRMRELQCCDETVKQYYLGWSVISLPLTRFLETLRQWNCTQFHEQCEKRVFAFTDYSNLVYDYFCNNNTLVEKCLPRIIKIISTGQNRLNHSIIDNLSTSYQLKLKNTTDDVQTGNTFNDSSIWTNALSQIQPSKMTLDELLEPCIQIAQYAKEEIHDGSYQEIVNFLVPTCQLSWCGFSGDAFNNHKISFWTCLSSRCQGGLLALLVILGILALMTTVLNILVILVLIKTSRLHNSQSTFKISLAIADLFVGVFVLPTCMYTLSVFLWTPLTTSLEESAIGYQEINGTIVGVETTIKKDIHENLKNEKLHLVYIDFVGFVTALSIFVSVYTLAAAGCDRLNAVYKPLSYVKSRANKQAKIACVISWLLAAVFALMPIITQESVLVYGIVFSLVVVSLEHKGVLLLVVVLFIPLVVVWIVNVSVYIVIKRHHNIQRRLTISGKSKGHGAPNVEKRLAKTLQIMVGVFTINTLPLWIVLLCNFFIPNISSLYPESLDPKAFADFTTVQIVAAILLFGNSLCNFFIYNIRSEEFRKALRRTVKEILEKIGLASCYRLSGRCIRRATGQGRRKLSTVSLSIIKLHRSSNTEETAVDKTLSISRVRGSTSAKSDSDEHKPCGQNNKYRPGELLSVSDHNDSVFHSASFNQTEWNKLPSTVTKQFSDVIDVVDQTHKL